MTTEDHSASAQVPTWYVLGAGAMGCLWAAWLHLEGVPVRLLLRDASALQRYQQAGGLRLRPEPDAEPIGPLPLAAEVLTSPGRPVQRLLLATKAQHALAAVAALGSQLSPAGAVLMLQNGLAVQQQLTARLGSRAFCLTTSHGAYLQADFDVVHAGRGRAWLGSLQAPPPLSRLQSLRAELPWQRLQIVIEPQMATRLWRKLAVNCAVNALTVIHDCPNGELLQRPAAQQQLLQLCAEIESLFEQLPDAPAVAPLFPQVAEVLQQTAHNLSSTLQDARRQRPSELACINGYLCQRALAAGLDCRRNQQVLERAMLRSGSGGGEIVSGP